MAFCGKETDTHTVRTGLLGPKRIKSKAIPVTGRGGLEGCKMLRIPHCLDNRLTDGIKVTVALLPSNIFMLLVLISVRG
jgi:hypothetical protein